MRVVTNLKIIQRNRQMAQLLFYISMGGLVLSFLFGNSISSDPQAASVFQCIVLPMLFILVILSVRMTNTWMRKPEPWIAIQEGMKGVSTENNLYHYVFPAPHVVIGPDGIFAMVTRFQDRPYIVKDDRWNTNATLLSRFLMFARQEQIGDPTYEAKLKAAQTQAFLRELLQDQLIEVHPLIIFIHPKANVTVEGESSVPILYGDPDRKKDSLKQFFRNLKKQGYPTITKEQIAEVDDALLYED
jgi:hypothetical protein